MMGSYWVAAQLAVSQEELSSLSEWVIKHNNFQIHSCKGPKWKDYSRNVHLPAINYTVLTDSETRNDHFLILNPLESLIVNTCWPSSGGRVLQHEIHVRKFITTSLMTPSCKSETQCQGPPVNRSNAALFLSTLTRSIAGWRCLHVSYIEVLISTRTFHHPCVTSSMY
jgi:hypothetical protein